MKIFLLGLGVLLTGIGVVLVIASFEYWYYFAVFGLMSSLLGSVIER